MMGSSDRCVVVTGAASGIGLGIAQAFHRVGANAVVSNVREDALAYVSNSFVDSKRVRFVTADVREDESVERLLSFTEEAFGPVSVMAANAGIVPNLSVLTHPC